MAIAVGKYSAYEVQVIGNELSVVPTMVATYHCAPIAMAMAKLAKGEAVTVRGSEMVTLRSHLRDQGVWCEDMTQ